MQRNENLIRVLNYIDQNISENITAEELSQVSGYSFYHFCHLFTNLSGESISAYLRHRRLQLASDRLLEGRSVTDTAFSCGFDTPSGFAKAFRKLYQISPTEYKTMPLTPAEANLFFGFVSSMDTALRQFHLSAEDKGEYIACLEARKYLAWYLRGVPYAGYYKEKISAVRTAEEVDAIVKGVKRDLK